jgi:phosphate:Na+ symporter
MTSAHRLLFVRRALPHAIVMAAALLTATHAAAQSPTASASIDWVTLAMGGVGGLALSMYGVGILAESLKRAQGSRFRLC